MTEAQIIRSMRALTLAMLAKAQERRIAESLSAVREGADTRD